MFFFSNNFLKNTLRSVTLQLLSLNDFHPLHSHRGEPLPHNAARHTNHHDPPSGAVCSSQSTIKQEPLRKPQSQIEWSCVRHASGWTLSWAAVDVRIAMFGWLLWFREQPHECQRAGLSSRTLRRDHCHCA